MLRLLLDEHISPDVADGLRRRNRSIVIHWIAEWLKLWAEEERRHGGVIFVDEKTISPADIGGLVRALIQLSKETGRGDWTDRVYFLRRQH